jgi:hypothetical protein
MVFFNVGIAFAPQMNSFAKERNIFYQDHTFYSANQWETTMIGLESASEGYNITTDIKQGKPTYAIEAYVGIWKYIVQKYKRNMQQFLRSYWITVHIRKSVNWGLFNVFQAMNFTWLGIQICIC